jgi:hypothetical protein
MSPSKLKGLVVAVATVVSTLAFGVSSAWATTTPPGAYLWPGSAPGETASIVFAAVVVAVTAALAAAYGVFALRVRSARGESAEVRDIGSARRPSSERRKAA